MQVVEHLLKIRPGVWFNLVRGSVPRVSPFLAPRGRFWQFRFHRSAAVTCGLPLKQKLIISALKQPRVCLTVGFFFWGGGGLEVSVSKRLRPCGALGLDERFCASSLGLK